MNSIKNMLKGFSRAQCNKVVKYVGNDPKRFASLVSVFLEGPYRITQMAVWPITYCVEYHPELVRPHLKSLLLNLQKPGLHDAVKRNTTRLLQFIEIPESLQGYAAESCFRFLASPKEPVAVKVFSMGVLARLAEYEPALKNELIPLIEDQYPYASAAFRSRARHVLKKLKR